jgi:hypothetical protein
MLYLVCKILYSSNQQRFCPFMTLPRALDPWVEFLKALLEKPLPTELESKEDAIELRAKKDQSLHWKLKGLAAKLSYRMLSHCGKVYR